ncbi:MAG: rRNA methyltransferase, partial [Chloroflexi bacterium]|nr:rRNA methyltransferase [Chloroflexota bacterium]
KFAYTALSRAPLDRSYARIVRHPQIHKGHISLQLCTPEGMRTIIVSKRDGALFTRARKAEWGDIFPIPD